MQIIYTDDIPEEYAGFYDAPFTIKIRPAYRDDIGLLKHELEHYRQFRLTLGLHPLLYKLSKRYRLWSEVQAYRVQLQYPGGSAKLFASFICAKYDLDISELDALKLLSY